MYERALCPSCYLRNIVCMACKSDKPKYPCGLWEGKWWYCSAECAKTPGPDSEMCQTHRAALEKLLKSHPHLFRDLNKAAGSQTSGPADPLKEGK